MNTIKIVAIFLSLALGAIFVGGIMLEAVSLEVLAIELNQYYVAAWELIFFWKSFLKFSVWFLMMVTVALGLTEWALLVISIVSFGLAWPSALYHFIFCVEACSPYLVGNYVNAPFLTLIEYFGYALISSALIFISTQRYKIPVHSLEYSAYGFLWFIVAGCLLGFDVVLPIFLIILIRNEKSHEMDPTWKARDFSLLFFCTGLLQLFIYGHSILGASTIESLISLSHQDVSTQTWKKTTVSFVLTTGVYGLDTVLSKKGSIVKMPFISPRLINFFFANILLYALNNVSGPFVFSFILALREFEDAKTLYPQNRTIERFPSYFGIIGFWAWMIVVGCLLAAAQTPSMLFAVPLLIGFFSTICSTNLLNFDWGIDPKAYQEWMNSSFLHLFIVVCTLLETILIFIGTWSHNIGLPGTEYSQIYHEFENNTYLFSFMGLIIYGVYTILFYYEADKIKVRSHKWHVLHLTLFLLTAFGNYIPESKCDPKIAFEADPSHHARAIEEIRNVFEEHIRGSSRNGSIHAYRPQHPRSTGCAFGELVIDQYIPSRYRYGLFSTLGDRFPIYMRFSSSSENPHATDSDFGVHGLSLKILNVQGERNPDAHELNSQDILLLNVPTFFTNDIANYPLLFRAQMEGYFSILKWTFSWDFLQRLLTLFRVFSLALHSLQGTTNPLSERYFSTTPYKLGPHSAIKYSVVPCDNSISEERRRRELEISGIDKLPIWPLNLVFPSTPQVRNYMTHNMYHQLKNDSACFELQVQEQVDPCTEPIEDVTREWSTPWFTIGLIHIPQQETRRRDQLQFCENLQFNPWNGLKDHRPMGLIGHARHGTYFSLGNLRQNLNSNSSIPLDLPRPSPTGYEWNNFSEPILPLSSEGNGNTLLYDYQSYSYPGLPKHLKSLPRAERLSIRDQISILFASLKAAAKHLAGSPIKAFSQFTSPDDYQYLFDHPQTKHSLFSQFKRLILNFCYRLLGGSTLDFSLHLPAIHKTWRSDLAFAQQLVNGVNPMAITVVNQENPIPSDFNLAPNIRRIDVYLTGVGEPSFSELIEQGKIFVTDYEILIETPTRLNRIVYPAMGIFYLNHQDDLMPLCIQLTRLRDERDHVFFPDDLPSVWLFAKMHLASADSQVHEMNSHLALTHLAMEPIVIAFNRQLSAHHILLKFMKPHFVDTLAINALGRQTLLKADGTFDRIVNIGLEGSLHIISKQWARWHFVNSSFPRELKRRGFYEVTQQRRDNLPGFFYRDFGFKIWSAISGFVKEVVFHMYNSDTEVQSDVDLQNLIKELRDPMRAAIPGVPLIETRADLAEFLTIIYWTCTAQHAAVNFGQYEYYAFIPNRPLYLTKKMPQKDLLHLVDDKYILSALAPKTEAMDTIATATSLSLPSEKHLLPHLETIYGPDWPYRDETLSFIKVLQNLEQQFSKFNAQLESQNKTTYAYLMPRKIPVSIGR